MEVSIGDLVDRASILTLKIRHAQTESDKTLFEKELMEYRLALNVFCIKAGTDNTPMVRKIEEGLVRVNDAIWKLESDIRKGKEKKLGLEEVGRRALKIRDLNAKRIALKNDLNKKFNSGFLEKKIDHTSEKIDKNRYLRIPSTHLK